MKISEADEKDYEELVEVWEASVRATHHFLPEAEIQRLRPQLLTHYLPATELHCIRALEGYIVAFIGLEDTHIAMLFVRPEYRGDGYGRRLTKWAIAEKNARTVDVNEQNVQAVGFYLRIGFVVAGRSATDDRGEPFPILHLRQAERP